jgi:(4S)-4-hydroxy-5-phosphonooxypentane-2,3-dione isomerase
MGEFVLIVEMEVKPESIERFHELIAVNARASVETEPGCRQFDVMRSQDAANRILLYEVYDDLAAFEAHAKTAHVAAFFREARPLITTQTARRFERVTS